MRLLSPGIPQITVVLTSCWLFFFFSEFQIFIFETITVSPYSHFVPTLMVLKSSFSTLHAIPSVSACSVSPAWGYIRRQGTHCFSHDDPAQTEPSQRLPDAPPWNSEHVCSPRQTNPNDARDFYSDTEADIWGFFWAKCLKHRQMIWNLVQIFNPVSPFGSYLLQVSSSLRTWLHSWKASCAAYNLVRLPVLDYLCTTIWGRTFCHFQKRLGNLKIVTQKIIFIFTDI